MSTAADNALIADDENADETRRHAFVTALSSFLPEIVKQHIFRTMKQHDTSLSVPLSMQFDTVCMFCDVSGFTKLSHKLAQKGPVGAEELGFYLNQYLNMMASVIAESGGDVFKFAGDAMLVLYPPAALMSTEQSPDVNIGKDSTVNVSQEEVTNMVHRAGQVCVRIQSEMGDVVLGGEARLQVKLGIGVGRVSILLVGGVFGRIEYLACGSPLLQAFASEGECTSGDIVMSSEAFALVQSKFIGKHINEHSVKISGIRETVANIPILPMQHGAAPSDIRAMKRIIPSAVLPQLAITEKKWLGELRQVSVLFISLGLSAQSLRQMTPEKIKHVHQLISTVQSCVYEYQGSLNKFLIDDKGSTIVAVFGLPPLAHVDDPARALLSGLKIRFTLLAHGDGISSSCGITTGLALCGVVGGDERREYTVLGDVVNMSARLMQAAKGNILCSYGVAAAAKGEPSLRLDEMPAIHVKGKVDKIRIFRPSFVERVDPIFAHSLTEEEIAYFTPVERKPVAGEEVPKLGGMRGGSGIRTIGQSQPLDRLNGICDSTIDDGYGQIVMVNGHLGTGKTHILRHITYSRPDIHWVWGTGDQYQQYKPHSYAWTQITRQLCKLANLPEPPDKKTRDAEEQIYIDEAQDREAADVVAAAKRVRKTSLLNKGKGDDDSDDLQRRTASRRHSRRPESRSQALQGATSRSESVSATTTPIKPGSADSIDTGGKPVAGSIAGKPNLGPMSVDDGGLGANLSTQQTQFYSKAEQKLQSRVKKSRKKRMRYAQKLKKLTSTLSSPGGAGSRLGSPSSSKTSPRKKNMIVPVGADGEPVAGDDGDDADADDDDDADDDAVAGVKRAVAEKQSTAMNELVQQVYGLVDVTQKGGTYEDIMAAEGAGPYAGEGGDSDLDNDNDESEARKKLLELLTSSSEESSEEDELDDEEKKQRDRATEQLELERNMRQDEESAALQQAWHADDIKIEYWLRSMIAENDKIRRARQVIKKKRRRASDASMAASATKPGESAEDEETMAIAGVETGQVTWDLIPYLSLLNQVLGTRIKSRGKFTVPPYATDQMKKMSRDQLTKEVVVALMSKILKRPVHREVVSSDSDDEEVDAEGRRMSLLNRGGEFEKTLKKYMSTLGDIADEDSEEDDSDADGDDKNPTITIGDANEKDKECIMLVADHAQAFNTLDWAISLLIAKLIDSRLLKHVTLIISCRPLYSKIYAPKFSATAPEFFDITDNLADHIITPDQWSRDDTAQYMNVRFHATSVNKTLLMLLDERCAGIAQFVTTFVDDLFDNGAIAVRTSGGIMTDGLTLKSSYNDLCNSSMRQPNREVLLCTKWVESMKTPTNQIDTDMSIPVPDSILRVSAFFIDILTPSQIFALKMASCICLGKGKAIGAKGVSKDYNNEFRLDILESIHNIKEYRARLQEDLDYLAQLGVLTIRNDEAARKAGISMQLLSLDNVGMLKRGNDRRASSKIAETLAVRRNSIEELIDLQPLDGKRNSTAPLSRDSALAALKSAQAKQQSAAGAGKKKVEGGADSSFLAKQLPTYQFKYGFLRDVVYQLMLYSQRRHQHLSVAEWLQSRLEVFLFNANYLTFEILNRHQRLGAAAGKQTSGFSWGNYAGETNGDNNEKKRQSLMAKSSTAKSSGGDDDADAPRKPNKGLGALKNIKAKKEGGSRSQGKDGARHQGGFKQQQSGFAKLFSCCSSSKRSGGTTGSARNRPLSDKRSGSGSGRSSVNSRASSKRTSTVAGGKKLSAAAKAKAAKQAAGADATGGTGKKMSAAQRAMELAAARKAAAADDKPAIAEADDEFEEQHDGGVGMGMQITVIGEDGSR